MPSLSKLATLFIDEEIREGRVDTTNVYRTPRTIEEIKRAEIYISINITDFTYYGPIRCPVMKTTKITKTILSVVNTKTMDDFDVEVVMHDDCPGYFIFTIFICNADGEYGRVWTELPEYGC